MCGVLIVDDDKNTLDLLRSVLEGNGVKAVYASSGEEAVCKIMEEPSLAMLITDLNMPGMDGIELAMLAKEISPDLTVVMMTGDISPEVPQLATEAGVSKILAKPVSADQIITIARSRKYFFR